MNIFHNISAHKISWVKSNQEAFEEAGSNIRNLYYPENIEELIQLVIELKDKTLENVTIIGYSSNTLFLPSFSANNVICTKELNQWCETDQGIVCECGVCVSKLAKEAIGKGYVGFEGLTDLPGTIGAAVYGNCGCRGCSINALLDKVEILQPNGEITFLYVTDLNLQYRSSSLKRGEISGIILRVYLRKVLGNAERLKEMAASNHDIRKQQQPSGANNLGTTFIGGKVPTFKGRLFLYIEFFISKLTRTRDTRVNYPKVLKMIGKGRFSPYVYYWNRYMFSDKRAHLLFPEYIQFVKSLYKDAELEIEIRS